jgi:hypothetical protein
MAKKTLDCGGIHHKSHKGTKDTDCAFCPFCDFCGESLRNPQSQGLPFILRQHYTDLIQYRRHIPPKPSIVISHETED